jgi:hypothetical protein
MWSRASDRISRARDDVGARLGRARASVSSTASDVAEKATRAGKLAATTARFGKHAGKAAYAYVRHGERGGGEAIARAFEQQATRHYGHGEEFARLSARIPALLAAANRGDVAAAASVALHALAEHARHASLHDASTPEGESYVRMMARRFIVRLPKILDAYMRDGGDAGGAAMMEELIEHAADMARSRPSEHQPRLAHTARKLAKGAVLLARATGRAPRPVYGPPPPPQTYLDRARRYGSNATAWIRGASPPSPSSSSIGSLGSLGSFVSRPSAPPQSSSAETPQPSAPQPSAPQPSAPPYQSDDEGNESDESVSSVWSPPASPQSYTQRARRYGSTARGWLGL